MGDYLSSLVGGIARFALAWLLPTAIAVGLFWAVSIPALAEDDALSALTGAAAGSGQGDGRAALQAIGLAAFATFAISVLLAYASQFIYRLLEGYHLPSRIDRVLTGRQMRRRARLVAEREALAARPNGDRSKRFGLVAEQLELYPDESAILPTRLGNALKAMEFYGHDRFGMDSQQFWYELVATSSDPLRREVEEMRAQVDLFVAAIAVFALLSGACVAAAIGTNDIDPLLLAAVAALFVPIAYRGALRNMKEWRNSVRAMVNLGRYKVADGIGVSIPWRIDDERFMWQSVSGVLHYQAGGYRPWFDFFRKGTTAADADGVIREVPRAGSPDRQAEPAPSDHG